jgi:hypothetical protein
MSITRRHSHRNRDKPASTTPFRVSTPPHAITFRFPRTDDEDDGGISIMVDVWPSESNNKLAEAYESQSGPVKVDVSRPQVPCSIG